MMSEDELEREVDTLQTELNGMGSGYAFNSDLRRAMVCVRELLIQLHELRLAVNEFRNDYNEHGHTGDEIR